MKTIKLEVTINDELSNVDEVILLIKHLLIEPGESLKVIDSEAIAEHEAGRWQSFGKKIPYGYAKIMVIFPPEAKQEANIVTYDPDADDYQDGDIWAYVTDLFPEPYQEGGER